MRVQSSQIGESICHKQHAVKASSAAASFAEVLAEANTFRNPVTTAGGEMLSVGVISAGQPTVSDLLVNNSQFRDNAWDIIYSAANAGKDYARMQPGTRVSINRNTLELVWEEGGGAPVRSVGQAMEMRGGESLGSSAAAGVLPAASGGEAGGTEGEKISLGRLDRDTPTVSHLLLQSREYGRDAWRILQADSNRGKSFADIRAGEEIFIDPQTLAISRRQSAASPMAEAPAGETPAGALSAGEEQAAGEIPADPLSSGLVEAVQPYLGRSYREINCYGLLVRGLSRMGIQYGGRGGLQHQLVQMAKSKGLPANAYLTGEGIIEASGEKVFTKILNSVGDAEKTAASVYNEMAPFLQSGYILSFSTRTKGHTGVISQHDQAWTFINSGYLDNQVDKSGRTKGVGEEDLAREITNWCRVAAKRGESLMITLGRLEEDKLRTAQRGNTPSLQKVL